MTTVTSQGAREYRKQYLVGTGLLAFFMIMILVYHLIPVGNSKGFKDSVGVITDIAFLNTVHIGFTVFGFLFVPAMRGWLKDRVQKDSLVISVILLTIGVFALIYSVFLGNKSFFDGSRLLMRSYGVHHAIFQSYGIFVLFTNKGSYRGELKNLFYLQSSLYVVALIVYFFDSNPYENPILYIVAAVSLFGVVLVLWKVRDRREDLFFLSRMIIYPIGILSPIAGMAISAFHGVEYGLFYTSLAQKDSSMNSRSKLFFLLGMILFAGLCVFNLKYESLHFFEYKNLARNGFLVLFFWVVMDSCNVLHYYFDSILFKTRDKFYLTYLSPLIEALKLGKSKV